MFPNLRAEMTRKNLKTKDICKVLNVSEKTARNYLTGRTKISWLDVLIIREKLFPELEVGYLFQMGIDKKNVS